MFIDTWTYSAKMPQGWLEESSGFDARDLGGDTPLHLAAQSGHVASVVSMVGLEKAPTTPPKNSVGETPLHFAARDGHLGVVDCLLGCTAATVDDENCSKVTPLHLAAKNNHIDVVRFLVEKGSLATIKAKDARGWTSLHYAAKYGHVVVFKYLMGVGACVMESDWQGLTPMGLIPDGDTLKEILELFSQDKLMHQSAYMGNLRDMKILQNAGVCLDDRDPHGRTPLHIAAQSGCLDVVKWILEDDRHEILINEKDVIHCTPLHLATQNCLQLGVLQYLLKKGTAEVDAKTSTGETPMHVAALHGNSRAIALLVNAGADVNARSLDGRTPLHIAAKYGHFNAVKTLGGLNA